MPALTIVSPPYPSYPMTKPNGDFETSSSKPPTRLDTVYIMTQTEETTMTGHGRERVRLGTDGRYGKQYVHATQSGSLSSSPLPASLRISPPQQHLISHTQIQPQKDAQRRRERERRSRGREKREPPKKASIWETEFFISIHKKRGGEVFFWFCSWSQATKRGRRKGRGHKPQKPPFLVFYCHLIQFIAHCLFLWSFSSPFLLILLYLYSLFCKLPSSSECYCA